VVKVDRIFSEPKLAELYDAHCALLERSQFDFYLPLIMSADRVLDIGCGTGELLRTARQAAHAGRLCGLDPAQAMLDVARRHRPDVEWVLGDLSMPGWQQEFDLVVMTGHAFQVFLEDDELCVALAAIRRALTDEGRFIFETRNPLDRAWERWKGPPMQLEHNGSVVSISGEVFLFDGEYLSFASTFTCPEWDTPEVSHSTLRFLSRERLNTFLNEAGLAVEEQFGDWDQRPFTDACREIITIARPG
jgi:ubiquinone/menaquinone biosynthesis C-methylase UbiE